MDTDALAEPRSHAAARGRQEGWWKQPLPDAREVPVPASYNDVFAAYLREQPAGGRCLGNVPPGAALPSD